MTKIHEVSEEGLKWLDDAVGYDNVASVGAAYGRLLELRNKIESGTVVRFVASTSAGLTTVREFDGWVRQRYPVFADDPLHPIFRTSDV